MSQQMKRSNLGATAAALAGAVGMTMFAGCSLGSGKRSSRMLDQPASQNASRPRSQPSSSSSASKLPPLSTTEKAALREKALALLVTMAQNGTPEERANALEALVQTPQRLASVAESGLTDQNLGVRAVAAMAVGKARLATLAPRVRPLLQDESPFVRAAAMFALKRFGASVDISPLAGMLFDSSARVRAQAAYVLGEMGDKSAVPLLREAHKSLSARANPTEVRLSDLQLAEARVKLGDDSALADVRSALFPAKEEDLEAAVLAVQIIGQIKDAVSVNRLIELTAQKEPGGQELPGELRMAAASALARMGQPHGTYIAQEYFQGEKESLRAQAASLLGDIQRPENLQIVSRLMEDPDGRVRIAAAAAVVKITDRGE
jgi:HEAT repeat protein